MQKIDVVVVTYNRLQLLKECVNSLIAQKKNLSQIFIINNCSTDETLEYLRSLKENKLFCIFNLNSNIGGAAGFEYGIKMASERGNGKYIWIMDDDTIPSNSASYELLRAANQLHDNFGFLCSNDRWRDGSATNIPKASSRWTSLAAYGLIEVLNATFVSVLTKKSTVMKVGLPLGQMKIWGDDTEYTTRLSRHSPSYFVSNSIVLHKTNHNLSNDSIYNISSDRLWRYQCLYRNLIYIDRKYYSNKRVVKAIIHNFIDIYKCLSTKSNKTRKILCIIRGTWSGLFFNPKIHYCIS